jgi:ABC-type Mn2+/Zn2+ transport system permease subunit
MVAELFALLWAPFLMCLVLTGIHAYLGFHVLAREVVFVDIALAQIAALGATGAFLVGYELDTWESYACGLTATIVGALVLSLTRTRERLRRLVSGRGPAGRPCTARRRASEDDARRQSARRAMA